MTNGFILQDEQFGDVAVCLRRGMRSFTARWKANQLHINASPSVKACDIQHFIDSNRQQIERIHAAPLTYHPGQTIHCFRHRVTIRPQEGLRNRIGYGGTGSDLFINVSADADFTSPAVVHTISACLKRLMERHAHDTLIDYAQTVARQVGIAPHHFEIGRGMRKLGHCTSTRVIQLSYNVMFLPEPLVRLIICHELAHLTEMNHSQRFHALCDTYCNGREKHLELALKNFVWPVIR